ncbi:MarR family transcriptional regulator [Candidatus Micrarchaeota archaeon]|nr:MarR family transcriptional regulator [Candidatus Micrarchaeota archaeon]
MEKISRKIEDYLECIYLIQKEKGYLRVKDIARKMKVKPPSVVEMLRRLQSQGFVRYERHGALLLTKKGAALGRNTAEKHETFRKLLVFIGLPEETASEDACEMEHHLHPETISHFIDFVDYLENSEEGKKHRKNFLEYSKINEMKRKN